MGMTFTEDEIVLLINLLMPRRMELMNKNPDTPPMEEALFQKLFKMDRELMEANKKAPPVL